VFSHLPENNKTPPQSLGDPKFCRAGTKAQGIFSRILKYVYELSFETAIRAQCEQNFGNIRGFSVLLSHLSVASLCRAGNSLVFFEELLDMLFVGFRNKSELSWQDRIQTHLDCPFYNI
jgi:hypothetical protein